MLAVYMPTPSPVRPAGALAPAPSDARLTALATSVAMRLGPACRNWDAAEFDALVERIVRTKLRWADAGYAD